MNLDMTSLTLLIVLGVVSFWGIPVSGHGRLWNPPARGTMWRQGFMTPMNPHDDHMNCGGFEHQVSLGYKCGVCGDPFNGARLHEAQGPYATGVITKVYNQGQRALFQVDLTANQKGFFEFRVCDISLPHTRTTQECLDQNLLDLNDSNETKHFIDFDGPAMVNVTVRLPATLTCDFCVVQWRYHTGNRMGAGPNGTTCLGCGYQEEFYGCADISIVPATSEPSSSPQPLPNTTDFSTPTFTTAIPTARTATTTAPVPSTPGEFTCVGVGSYSHVPSIEQWCLFNCMHGFCPGHICSCS